MTTCSALKCLLDSSLRYLTPGLSTTPISQIYGCFSVSSYLRSLSDDTIALDMPVAKQRLSILRRLFQMEQGTVSAPS